MYSCVFSRSEGAGSATTRNTRGLTRSVRARIVPPFPAVSRPSNTMTTRWPFALTHSCRLTSSACSLRSRRVYSLFFSFVGFGCLLMTPQKRRTNWTGITRPVWPTEYM